MVYHSSTSNNKTCLFVLNPISGNFDKEDLRKWLKDYATKNSLEFWFHETTGSGEEAALLTGSIEKYKPSCLVAVGGDGTVNLVAKVAKEVKIPIGIFPMGSANGLATELDIPFNREEALDVVLHGAIIRIDILNINKREIVLHLCDVGLNARVIKRFEKAVIRGFIGYMGQYFKELFDVKTTRFMLIVNGQKFKTKAIMVVIANASKYGTGAIINPPGKINDGSFEVIFIKPYPFWYIFKLIVVFFTGTLHKNRYVKLFSCKKATLINYGRQPMQVDGEPVKTKREIEISIEPAALQVKVPSQNLLLNQKSTNKNNSQ